jgi:hypothetical protein
VPLAVPILIAASSIAFLHTPPFGPFALVCFAAAVVLIARGPRQARGQTARTRQSRARDEGRGTSQVATPAAAKSPPACAVRGVFRTVRGAAKYLLIDGLIMGAAGFEPATSRV